MGTTELPGLALVPEALDEAFTGVTGRARQNYPLDTGLSRAYLRDVRESLLVAREGRCQSAGGAMPRIHRVATPHAGSAKSICQRDLSL